MGQSIWLNDLNDPALAGRVYDWIEAMLEAGAEGAVVTFADEAAMRDFAGRHL